tara:strand:- start:819 stop:2414 length:1596 start_codon:yes stop_codon:yes gene_type:complete
MAKNEIGILITAKDLTKGIFRKLNASLGLVRRSIFSLKAGLVSVAGAAGLGLLVKSSLQSIDTLGKTASKLGVTSQALQKLRFASQLAGVETRTVDMAVQRFTRRLSEAAQNTGEAKDALKELGLNAKELSKQPLEKQMLTLADAFEDVKSSGDRVRLAFKLFDSEGVAFVNTLQGGSSALQEMFRDAESLGFILSNSAVKGVERANDSIGKLFVVLKGVTDQMVAALAPALRVIVDLLTNKIANAIKETGGIEEFAKALAISVINMVENISKSIAGFVNKIRRGLNFLIDAAVQLGKVIKSDTLESIQRVGEFASVGAGFFQDLRDAVNGVGTALENTNNQMDKGAGSASAYGKKLKELSESAKDVKANLEGVAVRGVKSLEDALVDVAMQTTSTKDAFKSMAKSIIADLIRMQIQKSVTGPISAALSGMFAGPTAPPTGLAIGGPVQRGQPYLVGERGPELMVPNQSGSIVPNGAGGGGVVVNQTINLSAGVSQTVRAEVMQMLPQISNAAKGAVLDARRRGGSFAAAF